MSIDCVDYEMQYTHHSNAIKYTPERPSINAQIFRMTLTAGVAAVAIDKQAGELNNNKFKCLTA
jgi:hypothetical protein